MALPSLSRMAYFYPRPLRGGRPCVVLIINQFVIISIHALCEEGDGGHGAGPHHHLRISIHALCEEGDRIAACLAAGSMYFYPRPLRGGRLCSYSHFRHRGGISIHALCEEGDRYLARSRRRAGHFYPRPLRGGRHESGRAHGHPIRDFYPRPLRGGRLYFVDCFAGNTRFLSTPSARRATAVAPANVLAETYFYPRPLRGGRRKLRRRRPTSTRFLSTPSARRATQCSCQAQRRRHISIHALCEEGDRGSGVPNRGRKRFLSTPSARRATLFVQHHRRRVGISIHALCEEGD